MRGNKGELKDIHNDFLKRSIKIAPVDKQMKELDSENIKAYLLKHSCYSNQEVRRDKWQG